MVFIGKFRKIDPTPFFSLRFLKQIQVCFLIMKSEDLQKVVTLKHQNGDYPTKIFRDLNGVLGLRTIERWCKMLDQTGSINLTTPPGPARTVRTKGAINKIKKKT
jgi:hypothetical protein